jgi:integrase
VPKRKEKLPRYFQRRDDNGKLRVRVQVPPALRPLILSETGKPLTNLLHEFDTGSLREAQRIERRDNILYGLHARIEAVKAISHRFIGSAQGRAADQMVGIAKTVMVMRQPGRPLDLIPGGSARLTTGPRGEEYLVQNLPVDPAPPIRPAVLAEYPEAIRRWAQQQSIDSKGEADMTTKMGRLAEHSDYTDIGRITADHIIAFKQALFDGQIDPRIKSPKTVENYMKGIRTLFRFAKGQRMITVDPFVGEDGITFTAKRNPKTTRLDFRPEQRWAILQHARQCDDPVIKWISIVLLYSGMRLAEIAEASTRDIWQVNGIPVLHIDHEHRAENETLKNDDSQRMVPLHPSVVKLGFLEYVAMVIEKYGHGPLFPMLDGKRSDQASSRIRRWFRDVVGIKDTRRAPTHSHRHTAETLMMEEGVRPDVAKRITGHLPEDIAERDYIHYRVPALYAAIKKIPDPAPSEPRQIDSMLRAQAAE